MKFGMVRDNSKSARRLRTRGVWLVAALLMAAGATLGQTPVPVPAGKAPPAIGKAPTPVIHAAPTGLKPNTATVPGQNSDKGRFVVVLDAAHGGEDAGAQLSGDANSGTVLERVVTLSLSVRLRSLLTARGFQVVTTREGNTTLDGDARAQIANHAGAGACLSLHASATGSGVHLFVSSLAATGQTRFLAWKTAQSAYITRSLKLASLLNSTLEHSGNTAGDGNSGTLAIPVTLARTALPGVDSMTCPAVVLEVAPIRGADRTVVTNVMDSQYEGQIVDALAASLLEWRTGLEAESGGKP